MLQKFMLGSTAYKIVIIGAGNVATHFGKRLQKKGHEVLQVLGRSEKSARELGTLLSCAFTTEPAQINRDANVYFLCVPDEEIVSLGSSLKLPGKLVIHTSGSVRLGALKSISSQCGVIYPVYSFSKQLKVSFSSMPLLIEASNKNALADVLHLAHDLGKTITQANSEQRMKVHLAAVFVNNFTNFLFSEAYDFLKGEKLNHFHLLQPLIRQTVKKIKNPPPAQVQTGPARRNDKITIEKHLELLEGYPDQKQVYKLLSALIQKKYHG
jgi:predicted short-subunit dehydrogenase-like oxidoreductase (DUF2520 family)